MQHQIKTLNAISDSGLKIFSGGEYLVGQDIQDPHALIVRSAKVDTDEYPSLLAVARAGAGFNNISVEKATLRGICVFNTPGANANAVAELVFIVLGMIARRVDESAFFVRSLRLMKDSEISELVEAKKSNFAGFELAGKTLGVIGLGKIGVLVANAGIRSGMKVIGYDAFPTIPNIHQLEPEVVLAKRMEEVLSVANVLTVHVPFSEKTRGLVGSSQIALLQPGCILINYARQGIYDDDAVLNALFQKKIACYLSDFPTGALINAQNVFCTSHLGASTAESEEKCATMAAQQLKNYLELGTVSNSVNFPVVELVPRNSVETRLAIVNSDVPNMISKITRILGNEKLNIQAMANESNGRIGYNLIDLDRDVDKAVAEDIAALQNVLRVRIISL